MLGLMRYCGIRGGNVFGWLFLTFGWLEADLLGFASVSGHFASERQFVWCVYWTVCPAVISSLSEGDETLLFVLLGRLSDVCWFSLL